MSRWTGPGRFTAQGGDALSRSGLADLQSKARKVVGDLENQARLGNVWFGKRVIDLGDGAKLIATVDRTYPDNPLVQSQIYLERKEVLEEEQVSEYELVIVRDQFQDRGSGPGDVLFISLAKFKFSPQGVLRFMWEDFLPSTSSFVGRHVNFTTDKAIGWSRTTLYNPTVPGFFNCWNEVQLRPQTQHTFMPVGTASAGFGSSDIVGFSANEVGSHIIGTWPWDEIGTTGCSGRTLRAKGLGTATSRGFHFPEDPRNVQPVAYFEYGSKSYIFTSGFDNSNSFFISQRIWEIDDENQTADVIFDRLTSHTEDFTVGIGGQQMDSERGIAFVMFVYEAGMEIMKYDLANKELLESGVAPFNNFSGNEGLGYDPATKILIAFEGDWDGTKFDTTLHFIDSDTMETYKTSKVVNTVPRFPDFPQLRLNAIAPIGPDAEYLLGTFVSQFINLTEFGKTRMIAFVVFRKADQEETGYKVIDVIQRSDVQPDHPANQGLNANFNSRDIFVRPVNKSGSFISN